MNPKSILFIACMILVLVGLASCTSIGKPVIPELDMGEEPDIPERDTEEEPLIIEPDGGEEPINQPAGEGAQPSQSKVMLTATWTRVELIVDGVPQSEQPATLTLQENSFVSSGACITTGDLSIEEETYTMVMTQSNCPGVVLPLTLTYAYRFEDDGQTLITETGNVIEIYRKQ
jgi:hypothetical protein